MELQVPDMTCGHCSGVIERAVKDVDTRAIVDIDIATRTVRIESTRPANDFVSAIREAGYSASVRA
ncbi:heavy-metal-associated domain-containing protein (plasmid) [Burkholderia thailandensis]|uniref:heavy-metal-associated domain-containing protein n=1 Tax=Burkholderia thailandensis TaxID=57975 RepID=UPI00192D3D3C|nr:heavy-metal-associated domain-containing protein [Burkholderia thailandensis]MBS2132137.1 heavy-metal-associated domain-containing protein [Burkholderia thailandensis]QRA15243.1 heavy-metal-associated domain-containing protein [Burkholderia thailandensis]